MCMYVRMCVYVCQASTGAQLRLYVSVRNSCYPVLSLSLSHVQNDRVLFHYNGHGVPKPTLNGEIWVFNKVSACGKGYQL